MANGGDNRLRLAPVGMRNGIIEDSGLPLTQPKAQNRQHQAPMTTVQARIPPSICSEASSWVSLSEAATAPFDSVTNVVAMFNLWTSLNSTILAQHLEPKGRQRARNKKIWAIACQGINLLSQRYLSRTPNT
jgi:hypothetical protein